jgi:type IV fimbrial biogenesis protein FimT
MIAENTCSSSRPRSGDANPSGRTFLSARPQCVRRTRRSIGFTLIELLVTVSIVAILAAMAGPSMRDMIIRYQTDAMAAEFAASINRARSEAATKNMCAVMCRSTLGSTLACNAGSQWNSGWIGFLNPTCDDTINTPAAANVFMAAGPFNSDYKLSKTGTSNVDKIMFSSTGAVRAGDAGEFNLQFKAETRPSNRSLCLSAAGQTRLVDFDGC